MLASCQAFFYSLFMNERQRKTLEESVRDPNGDYTHICGAVLLGKTVFLSVHDSPFALSGNGEVVTEVVPYCPNCDNEPRTYGTTRTNPSDVSDVEILKRIRDNQRP
jgi:hypothetical protein